MKRSRRRKRIAKRAVERGGRGKTGKENYWKGRRRKKKQRTLGVQEKELKRAVGGGKTVKR